MNSHQPMNSFPPPPHSANTLPQVNYSQMNTHSQMNNFAPPPMNMNSYPPLSAPPAVNSQPIINNQPLINSHPQVNSYPPVDSNPQQNAYQPVNSHPQVNAYPPVNSGSQLNGPSLNSNPPQVNPYPSVGGSTPQVQPYPPYPKLKDPPVVNSQPQPQVNTYNSIYPNLSQQSNLNNQQVNSNQNYGNIAQSYPPSAQSQPPARLPPPTQMNSYTPNRLANDLGGMSVTQQGFSKLWGLESVDLLKQRNVLPPDGVKSPEIRFQHEYMNSINCSPDVFRCSLTKIPETKTLLQKSRLPLGILIHPFKDLSQLPVIQCSTIVRCRSCRTYINPYVYFIDQRRWKCNLCFRVNDLPEEFQYDPISKTHGDPSRRPEVKSATIEFVAPADYMVRPPQAAIYLYVMDITANAVDTGYLKTVCDVLLSELENIPGDSRSQIGFITFDTAVHFYKLSSELSQPHQLVVCDIEDIFIPSPDDLLVSITECKDNIRHLLTQLPTRFLNTSVNQSALGAALQAAQKLLTPVGGRITVFQTCLPTIGPGALVNRETTVKNVKELTGVLNPSTDFYKKLALECSTHYIAVDLFFLNNQYVDIATISCVSKYSGGCIYQFPGYHITRNITESYNFEQAFHRYVTRKIGFEAVMRIRCSRGLSIHTFHGNFFVRSTDLLSLPNCNPDAGFGMQVSIDEPLTDFQTVCFQAALLYTSSKGERRIRVHTLCLPVTGNISDVLHSADQQCIVGLLAKMAVDRSLSSSLLDAREAFINAVVDALSAYMLLQNSLPQLSLLAPTCLNMLPAYTHAVLRSPGFRSDLKVKLDERVQFMNEMKCLPLGYLIQSVYSDLYAIHDIANTECIDEIPEFTLLQLCSDRIDANGVYLMDMPKLILVYVCRSVAALFCQEVFGVAGFVQLTEMNEFPELETIWSTRIRNFVNYLQNLKPHSVPVRIIREDSRERMHFVNNMIEDRGESSVSLYEFLQQLKSMVK